jgi:hypothetical protein
MPRLLGLALVVVVGAAAASAPAKGRTPERLILERDTWVSSTVGLFVRRGEASFYNRGGGDAPVTTKSLLARGVLARAQTVGGLALAAGVEVQLFKMFGGEPDLVVVLARPARFGGLSFGAEGCHSHLRRPHRVTGARVAAGRFAPCCRHPT